MTENEANMSIKHAVCVLESIGNGVTLSNENDREEACVLAIQAIDKVQQFEAIGTIEEFRALKENQRNCKDCAGCTNWKCDCANERDYAITQFANFLHEKAKENNGLRLSSETRSWTHPCIFDYLKEFKALKEKELKELEEDEYGFSDYWEEN